MWERNEANILTLSESIISIIWSLRYLLKTSTDTKHAFFMISNSGSSLGAITYAISALTSTWKQMQHSYITNNLLVIQVTNCENQHSSSHQIIHTTPMWTYRHTPYFLEYLMNLYAINNKVSIHVISRITFQVSPVFAEIDIAENFI